MPRSFNTAGPNIAEWHYTLPALERVPDLAASLAARTWFVLHAPRQTGKTTAMRALAAELTAGGEYAALWATCEAGEPYRHDPEVAERIVIESIAAQARLDLPLELRPPPVTEAAPGRKLSDWLETWCTACPRPVVLLLDEIDALQDDALISVLRQLRAIFPNRPRAAPSTVALIGLRDVRDYKVAAGGRPQLGGPSPFNVKVASLTLRAFDRDEVAALYAQHTAETGQVFDEDAIDLAFEQTQGQPWLVNALAYEVVTRMKVVGAVTAAHVEAAKERLILARTTHLDSLADKLNDPRVRAVIEPMLTSAELGLQVPQRDIDYCVDLGLVARDGGPLRVANPIYREVLPRELVYPTQVRITPPQRRWALADGRLDLAGVLEAFVDFWRQHGEWMTRGQDWQEAAHQIVLMAFLQRLVNGGGVIEREYALGTRRLDLLIRWHVGVDGAGIPTAEDRHAIEVKVWRQGKGDPLGEGLAQLDAYLQRLGLATGTLVVFDARDAAPGGDRWVERGVLEAAVTPSGRGVRILRG